MNMMMSFTICALCDLRGLTQTTSEAAENRPGTYLKRSTEERRLWDAPKIV